MFKSNPSGKTPASKPVPPAKPPAVPQSVPPAKAPAPAKEKGPAVTPRALGMSAHNFYLSVINKAVRITMLRGNVYAVTLVGEDRYELICKQPDGSLIALTKQAIESVAPDPNATNELPPGGVLPPASSENP